MSSNERRDNTQFLHNYDGEKSSVHLDGEVALCGTSAGMGDVIAVLVNRLGGDVEISHEEIKQIQSLTIHWRPEDIEGGRGLRLVADQPLVPQAGFQAVPVRVDCDFREQKGFWGFTSGSEDNVISHYVFYVPETYTEDERIAFIGKALCDKKDYDVIFSRTPRLDFLRSNKDSLAFYQREELEQLERKAKVDETLSGIDAPSGFIARFKQRLFAK